MLPLAVLAGGVASRLRPLTETTPKSLVEVAGMPFIAHQLNLLRREGVERVVLCVGHHGEKIEEFVGNGANFGLQVAYSFDGDRLLGTGGALRHALPLLGEAFFVLYGDSYLDVALAPIELAFRRHGLPALMTVFRNEGRWDTSNVVYDGARIVYHDKRARCSDTRYIDYGLGVLTAGALAGENAERPFDLGDAYSGLAARDMLAGYEVFRRFYEIGTPAGLAETDRYLREGTMGISDHTRTYYEEVAAVAAAIDQSAIERMIGMLVDLRSRGGRLFILGVGGGAGNAGHAVNDFRKICGIEAYAPTDNVSELTARINDNGWPTVFADWLRGSHIGNKDVVLVFSVGGGNEKLNVSANIVEALKLAKSVGAKVIGVVGRDGGYTREVADACVVVPSINPAMVTAHTEAFQAVVWHGIVSHPKLLQHEMKWEAVSAVAAREDRDHMPVKDGHIYAGVGGWNFAPWRGVFYPKGLPQAQELAYAGSHLTSIEINSTFYGSQKPESFRKWASTVPDGFVFSVKGSRFTTNRRVLAEAGDSINRFLNSGVLELKDRLGPILWQFAPTKKFDAADFGKFLELLPAKADGRRIRHVVEVRHPSFRVPEFIALLREFGIPVVFTDHVTYPSIADVTGDFVYARLQKGEDSVPTAYPAKELDAWADRLRLWAKGKIPTDLPRIDAATEPGKLADRNVFVYFIHEGKIRAPAAAMALIERLKA